MFSARLHDPRLRKGRALDAGETTPRIELPVADARAPAPRAAPTAGRRRGGRGRDAARPLERATRAARPRELVAEIYDALVLGTRDYVLKNGFETVVLGLSGGIDSALCACIAVDALGRRATWSASRCRRATPRPPRSEDAEALARALGIRFYAIPIQRRVRRLPARAGAGVRAAAPPDITEENLQARIRGNYLMALSNKFGWLVLTTGNKSEISVGYSTLYGDTAGGFAVLKDVYKTMVYQLARYRNRRGEPGDPGAHA